MHQSADSQEFMIAKIRINEIIYQPEAAGHYNL
jgi:hypothetical protein